MVLKVDVNADCDNHLVTAGDCLRLICSSAPQTDVTWHRADGQPIRSVQHSCDAQSPCAAGAGGDGVMVVEGVTVDDAGYYICTASFQNATVSKICFVSIGGKIIIIVYLYPNKYYGQLYVIPACICRGT